MEALITLLLSLLPFAFCALFMAVLALFVGLLFWRFFSRARVTPKVDGEAFLAQTRTQLGPLGPAGLCGSIQSLESRLATHRKTGVLPGDCSEPQPPRGGLAGFPHRPPRLAQGCHHSADVSARSDVGDHLGEEPRPPSSGARARLRQRPVCRNDPAAELHADRQRGERSGDISARTGLHIGQAFHPPTDWRANRRRDRGWLADAAGEPRQPQACSAQRRARS